MNCLIDLATKDHLCGLIRRNAPINFDVPFSGWTVTTNSSLDKGPLTVALQDYVYRQKARNYWVTQQRCLTGAAFDLIDWFTIGMPSNRHPQVSNSGPPKMSPPFVQPCSECIAITQINGHPTCVPCANKRRKLYSIYHFANTQIFRRFIFQLLPPLSSGWQLVIPIRRWPKPSLHTSIAKVVYVLVFCWVLRPSIPWVY
eukprot:9392995-Ditylum_brightwellii.AAC.1